jgi:hypothetical protein
MACHDLGQTAQLLINSEVTHRRRYSAAGAVGNLPRRAVEAIPSCRMIFRPVAGRKAKDVSRRFSFLRLRRTFARSGEEKKILNARALASCIGKEIRGWVGSRHNWLKVHTLRENCL